MPSDFEREYKNYIEANSPDLWSRIEAGIEAEEKNVAKSGQAGSVEAANVTTVDKADNKKIIRWGVFAKKAGQIAAAIALVFVAYGLVMFLAKGGNKASAPAAETAAPMADAAAPAMEEAAEAPAADMAAAEAADDMADSAPMAEATASDSEAPVLGNEAGVISLNEAIDSSRDLAAEASDDRKYKAATDTNAMAEEAEEEADEIYPESAEYESAELIDMTEIAPAERVTSPSGTQYKFGLTFEADDMTVCCLVSESDIKRCAENGVHLNKGELYKIDIYLREDVDPADSKYPYLLKSVDNAR